MKERPILMTPENAQKVFEGTKTQTRRLVKSQPLTVLCFDEKGVTDVDSSTDWRDTYAKCSQSVECIPSDYFTNSPWRRGMRLWIREAGWIFGSWKKNGKTTAGRQKWTFVEAGRKEVLFDRQGGFYPLKRGDAGFGFVRRPAIFMPRWACRTVVELTDVRVERLQEITEEDALAEGCGTTLPLSPTYEGWADTVHRELFKQLWESINGKGSWAQNHWVWCLSLKKVTR